MEYNLFKTEYADYLISQDGKIFNKKDGKPLQTIIKEGYNKVRYSIGTNENRITKLFRVDYLVESTYLSNPSGYRYINHKDGNNLNDSVDNLEWKEFCTDEPSKIIEGYNNKYIITKSGKVYNNITGFEMKQKDSYGYKVVALRRFTNNKSEQKLYKVHRLVAEAFISNPNHYPVVNHIDGNKSNNNVENLEWCTIKENSIHAINHQLKSTIINSTNGQCIIDLIEQFDYNYADVSKLLNINRNTIAGFYQRGYKTFGLKSINKFVSKHSYKKELTSEFINKYKDIIYS